MSTLETAGEFSDSLTGFEETAIAQRFGRTVTDLAGNDATMYRRCLVFAAKRREGLTDDDAWNAAMEMPIKAVLEFFAEVEDEGKAEAPEPPLASSPSGASLLDEAETSTSY